MNMMYAKTMSNMQEKAMDIMYEKAMNNIPGENDEY